MWDFGDGTATTTVFEPAHVYAVSGTYTVGLTTWDLQGDTAHIATQVVVYPQANATFFADINPVCPNVPVTFQYGFVPSVASMAWNFGDGATTNQVHPNHGYTAPGAYNVSLIVAGACGADTAQLEIVVSDSAYPVANFNVSHQLVCPGEPLAFNNQSANGAIAYEWFFADGDTSSLVSPVHSFSQPGGYDVQLVAHSACASDTAESLISGSNDTLSTFIIVDSSLVPDASFLATPATVCPGQTTMFSPNQEVLAGNAWHFGDGNTSSLQEPSHAFLAAGNYSVVHTAYNHCGNMAVDSLVVGVDATLQPTAGFTWFPQQLCPGGGATFINQSFGFDSLSWDFGDGSLPTSAANPVHAFATAGDYAVELTAFNACGQSNASTITVTVDSTIAPIANFLVGTSGPICPLDSVEFSNLSSETTNVVWAFGDGNSSIGVNPEHAYAATGVYEVKLVVTNGCNLSDSITQLVSVQALVNPLALIQASSASICPGDAVNLQSIAPTNGIASWNFGDGSTGSGASLDHTYDSAGVYTIELIVATLCGADTNTIQLVVIEEQEPQFSVTGSCVGGVVLFEDLTPGSSGVRAWSFGDGSISQEMQPAHTYADSGEYVVSLAVSVNGCTASTNDTIQIINPGGVPVVSFQEEPTTCPDSCDGTLKALVSGATAPLTYEWSNAATADSIGNLCAALWSVTIADANQCVYVQTASVTSSAAPMFTQTVTGADCMAANGTVAVASSGPGAPYQFLWDDGNAQTDSLATGLLVGTYNAQITDAAGCGFAVQVIIPDAGDLMLTGFNAQTVSCFGDNDGTAEMLVTGGTQPLTFSWNDNSMQTTQQATGLPPGNYSATVTDPNGCTDFDLVTIGEPLELSLSISTTPDSGSAQGTATVTVFGGTPGFQFEWNDPANQTGAVATGLTEGSYTVQATDTNGCVADETVAIALVSSAFQPAGLNSPIAVWPNPSTDFIRLSNAATIQSWRLLDAAGRVVRVAQAHESTLSYIDLGDLPAGVYMLTIRQESGTVQAIPVIKANL